MKAAVRAGQQRQRQSRKTVNEGEVEVRVKTAKVDGSRGCRRIVALEGGVGPRAGWRRERYIRVPAGRVGDRRRKASETKGV